MKKQDLQVPMTTDHDFPGKVSHCYTFIFISLRYDQVIMGKDAKGKGKGKSHAKRLKAENVPLKNKTLRNRRTA